MHVLAIGNSFSQDATQYLAAAARAAGQKIHVVNLYIGGCPLELHYRNMLSEERAYMLMADGVETGFYVSLKEALLNRSWDYITLQQASHASVRYETYQPYLGELAAYVRKMAPQAKLLLHETWAYEQGSQRLEALGYTDRKAMYRDVQKAYAKAAQDVPFDKVIPSGTLFDTLLDNGIPSVHRDTFHASLGVGRYALALLWLRALTGVSVLGNPFDRWAQPVSPEEASIVQQCVMQLI